MRIVIDTNRLIDLLRGVHEVRDFLEYIDDIFVPYICLAELRAGFLLSKTSAAQERLLQQFLNEAGVKPLYPDESTTHHYARLYAQLRKQGTPIGLNDIWIAALTLQHNLLLYSRDQDFDNLPQLARVSKRG